MMNTINDPIMNNYEMYAHLTLAMAEKSAFKTISRMATLIDCIHVLRHTLDTMVDDTSVNPESIYLEMHGKISAQIEDLVHEKDWLVRNEFVRLLFTKHGVIDNPKAQMLLSKVQTLVFGNYSKIDENFGLLVDLIK